MYEILATRNPTLVLAYIFQLGSAWRFFRSEILLFAPIRGKSLSCLARQKPGVTHSAYVFIGIKQIEESFATNQKRTLLLQLSNQSKVTGHTTTMTAKDSQPATWSLALRSPALVGKHVLGLRKG